MLRTPRAVNSVWRVSTPTIRRPLKSPTIHHEFRNFSGIPTILLPPVVFTGLLVSLWTWKCFMMVIFQNKIIYMPGLPPNARRETIKDYKNQCGGIMWKEEKTRSSDGTKISLCISSVETGAIPDRSVYIAYFQGNASSLPPRLPFLSKVLKLLQNQECAVNVRYKMVCCSYRGYWTSTGRPSEKGIARDAEATLRWIKDDHSNHRAALDNDKPQVIVWGQSIGAGVAAKLVAETKLRKSLAIRTLILETPFISIKAMLETLYPQKWLPYRYLHPFLRNHLNTWQTLGELGQNPPNVLILEAEKDELVPPSQPKELEQRCASLGLDVKRHIVSGALHTEIIARPEGRLPIAHAIQQVGECPAAS